MVGIHFAQNIKGNIRRRFCFAFCQNLAALLNNCFKKTGCQIFPVALQLLVGSYPSNFVLNRSTAGNIENSNYAANGKVI